MKKSGLIAVVAAMILLVGCAHGPYVVTDYESTYDFSTLKTFSVADPKQDVKENLLISPFTFSHVRATVESELAKRYQVAVKGAKPDFIVSYHIVVEEKIDPGTYNSLYGFGYYGRPYRYYPSPFYYGYGPLDGPTVYNQGSLIIDIVDGKTDKPIWRGVSEKRLRNGYNPQQQREVLSSAVAEVLATFPPVQ